jgi:hypothetical protein
VVHPVYLAQGKSHAECSGLDVLSHHNTQVGAGATGKLYPQLVLA